MEVISLVLKNLTVPFFVPKTHTQKTFSNDLQLAEHRFVH